MILVWPRSSVKVTNIVSLVELVLADIKAPKLSPTPFMAVNPIFGVLVWLCTSFFMGSALSPSILTMSKKSPTNQNCNKPPLPPRHLHPLHSLFMFLHASQSLQRISFVAFFAGTSPRASAVQHADGKTSEIIHFSVEFHGQSFLLKKSLRRSGPTVRRPIGMHISPAFSLLFFSCSSHFDHLLIPLTQPFSSAATLSPFHLVFSVLVLSFVQHR